MAGDTLPIQPHRADGGARNCGDFGTVFAKSQPVSPFVQYRFKQTEKRQLHDRHQSRQSTIINVPGPTSFQYLRTVNGILYDT